MSDEMSREMQIFLLEELCEYPDGPDDICPKCGGKLTISRVYGKYHEYLCENGECDYFWDDVSDKVHFGSGYY